jgi:hypothetical protein
LKLFRLNLLLTILFLIVFQSITFHHEAHHHHNDENSHSCQICILHINNNLNSGDLIKFKSFAIYYSIIANDIIFFDNQYFDYRSRSPPYLFI